MSEAIIQVNDLVKQYKIQQKEKGWYRQVRNILRPRYNTIQAVDHVSFEIQKGEIVGLLGRNGAGKSTTLKMMTGILYPDSGSVIVNGIKPYQKKKENAMQMGVVFGQRTQLWWDIPVIDTFELLKTLYKVSEKDYRKRLDMFMDIFSMESFIEKPVRQLSLGQRICSDLAAALLHNPPIVYLDEPTIGLDFLNKEHIREFIQNINKEYQTTVVITSHDLQDIEAICSRYLVIDHGKLICNKDVLKGEQIETTLRHIYENE